MRVLEIAACCTLGVALIVSVIPVMHRRIVVQLLGAGLTTSFIVAIFVTDQTRWQLTGVGVATFLVLALSLVKLRRPHVVAVAGTVAVAVFASVAMILSAALMALMPVTFLPQPTGPFPIGTTVFEVIDDTRAEIFTTNPNDHRTLVVQIWYPGQTGTTGEIEPYIRDEATFDGLLNYAEVPRFILRYLHVTPTHAVTDAPVAIGDHEFPVVFFLSGNLGYRQSNLTQVEELVSHGYVVVGIDQPGSASSVVFDDGTRIPYVGDAVLRPLVNQSSTPTEPAPQLFGISYPRGIANYLAADPIAVLESLAKMDAANGPLGGRLDLDQVGAFGMSLGGNVLSQWCTTDQRLDACLFIDAPMTQDAVVNGLDVPAMWITRPPADMTDEGWPDTEVHRYTESQRNLYAHTRDPAWYLEVPGIMHADLTDAPFGSPLFQLTGLTGPPNPDLHDAMRTYPLAFFDFALRDEQKAIADVLENSPANWPEIMATSHP